jgi:hypothetical protein
LSGLLFPTDRVAGSPAVRKPAREIIR